MRFVSYGDHYFQWLLPMKNKENDGINCTYAPMFVHWYKKQPYDLKREQ